VSGHEVEARLRSPSCRNGVRAGQGRRDLPAGRGWRYQKDVVAHLVVSQFAARYRGSLLGWLWALAPPLAQLGVFYFVFTKILPTQTEHFLIFLFTGIVAWTWFAAALTVAASALVGRRDLVLRPGFPTVLLPFVAVVVTLVDYLLALPVLLTGAAVTIGVHVSYALLPALLAIQFAFTAGLALLVAPLNVFFRDVGHLLALVLMLGFFMTPVFYSADQVPARVSWVYELNPLAQLIEAQRTILIERAVPDLVPLGLTAIGALAFLLVGLGVFVVLRQSVPDRL